MTDKLFDALEICLQALEQGEDVESALRRFPDLAGELRPMLEASLHARTLAGTEIPVETLRRGRARLLQRAAELREAKRAPRRSFLFTFRPVAITLMLVIFFLSGTGLVNASSGALPGDNLYTVKLTWEGLRLLFISDHAEREGLELEYENERFDEIHELLARGRMENVSFSGYVTAANGDQLNVGGLPVNAAGAILPGQPVTVGAAVMVRGTTQLDGTIQANEVTFLPADAVLPTVEPEEFEQDESNDHEESEDQSESDSQSTPDAPESNDNEDKRETGRVEGSVEMIQSTIWLVNGRPVDVSTAEIIGAPAIGVTVRIEGYYTADGRFVATRIEVIENDSGSGGNGDQSSNDNENDNSNDDNSNDDDNDNHNDDNKNDNDNDDD